MTSKLFALFFSFMFVMADSAYFSVLNPAQQTTPCASDAIGNMVGKLTGTSFCVSLVYKGFNETSSGIYVGAVGVSGALVKTFTSKATVKNECVTLTKAQITSLNAGNLYLNVLSALCPAGHSRGQIFKV